MILLKIKPFVILLLALLTLSFECSSSEETSEQTETNQRKKEKDGKMERLSTLAKEKFADNYSIQMNSEKSYVLCFTKSKDGDEQSSLKYFLYDLNNENIIFEEAVGRGSVKWLNDYQIQVSTIPGIVKGDEKSEGDTSGYIYDLKQKKKIFISKLKLEESTKVNEL